MNHEIQKAYTEMVNEATDNKYYAKWLGRVINSAITDVAQIKKDVQYKNSGAGSDTRSDKEKAALKVVEREINDIVIDLGKVITKAGKIKG